MAENQSTFIEELMAAGQGVFGLLRGDPKAARFFDFSPRGLVGGIIALILVTAASTYLQMLLTPDGPTPPGAVSVPAVSFLLLQFAGTAAGVGAAALILRQLNRSDALVPYLVADFWLTSLVALVALAFVAMGLTGPLLILGLFAVSLIADINIARLLIGLRPAHIAMLIAGRYVAQGLVGLIILLFILSPDDLSQLMNASASP